MVQELRTMNTSKYRNQKVSGYDSKKERDRAFELKMLERKGIISGLKEQAKFELIPAQYQIINGKRKCVEKSCSYKADFVYVDQNKNFIVEDAKGFKTEVYKIKKKLMLSVHGIRIKEV